MAGNGNDIEDDPKRVLIVGPGAAAVTLIDAVDCCGGQAFSIPLDKERYGTSWANQGAQGASFICHHTCTMSARQGFHANPVHLQVSSGPNETFWNNVFPTQLPSCHQNEVKRMAMVLELMRWLEVFFVPLPIKAGTSNATPEAPAAMLERLCTSPSYGMWYPTDDRVPSLLRFYETWRKDLVSRGVTVELSIELTEVVVRNKHGMALGPKPRTPVPDAHKAVGGDPNAPVSEEVYDGIILCYLADTAKRVLGRTAPGRKERVWGSLKALRELPQGRPAIEKLNGVDQASRLSFSVDSYRPMQCIRIYAKDESKLAMYFDTTNYQYQFPERVPFKQHAFQTHIP
ncbi:hypothetical protein DL765_005605 [Monosporascus sp. GIB2]|nr:hypothetical protein DL765_005605 [Monosporascus sp. GIB2]